MQASAYEATIVACARFHTRLNLHRHNTSCVMKMSLRYAAYRTPQFRFFSVDITKKPAKNIALNLIAHFNHVKALVFFIETYKTKDTNA